MKAIAPTLIGVLLVGWTLCLTGCARGPGEKPGAQAPRVTSSRVLTETGAAQLAAGLANEECARRYQKRPFVPEQYPAILTNSVYRWGGLDVGGPGGFSALVTFQADGSKPRVEVYFSSDALKVEKIQRPSPAPGIK